MRHVVLAILLVALAAPAAQADWSPTVAIPNSIGGVLGSAVALNPQGDAAVVWTWIRQADDRSGVTPGRRPSAAPPARSAQPRKTFPRPPVALPAGPGRVQRRPRRRRLVQPQSDAPTRADPAPKQNPIGRIIV